VANNIKGTMAIPHAYGRLQFGADLDLHFRTLIGTGANPNVAAVVVIGIEDGWTKQVVDGIAKTGKPVEGFGIEQNGDIATIAKASYEAKKYVQWASELKRRKCRPLRSLGLHEVRRERHDDRPGLLPDRRQHVRQAAPERHHGVFGETSEITGAEHICVKRAATPEAGEKFMKTFEATSDEVIEANKTTISPKASRPRATCRWPDDDRGEGARQPREDRPELPRRRARAG
jgi:(2R)-sulfolactate sulfo-lyase subunit beta